MARTVGYADTQAVQAFLTYLNKHYSKLINPKDTYLVAAVAAWFYQESGSLKNVRGNNPFNIRSSPLASGFRQTVHNGKFATFATMTKGFEAAAYLLIHGNKAYGYQLALNALKHGGNQAAVDFLAALARSSWDAARYGSTDWLTAYNPATNHLLRVYLSITGLQLSNPHPPKPKPKHEPPKLPVQYRYVPQPNHFLDPHAAKDRYDRRHGKQGYTQRIDGTTIKR